MLHLLMSRLYPETNNTGYFSFDLMVYLHDSGCYVKCSVVIQKPATIVTLHLTHWCTYMIQAATFRNVPLLHRNQ